MIIKARKTDNTKIYKSSIKRFNKIVTLMHTDLNVKIFMLSTIIELERKEAIYEMKDDICNVLLRNGIEKTRADSMCNAMFAKIHRKITARKAISASYGHFAQIEEENIKDINSDNVSPSIKHIYMSYYSNVIEAQKNIEYCSNVKLTYDEIGKVLASFPKNIMSIVERLCICPQCNKISNYKLRCSHKITKIRLYKIDNKILEGMKHSIILPIYIGRVLKNKGWKVYYEQEFEGTPGVYHQVDVFCKKSNIILLIECKNYAIKGEYVVRPKDIFRILGKYNDIEKNFLAKKGAYKIYKVFVTTSNHHKDIKKMKNRNDLLLIENSDIINKNERWVSLIEEKIQQ